MGTPQGGVISPLLANIAQHGLENHLKECFYDIPLIWPSGEKIKQQRYPGTLSVIRYADDFVVLDDNLEVIKRCYEQLHLPLAPPAAKSPLPAPPLGGGVPAFTLSGGAILPPPPPTTPLGGGSPP